VAVCLYGGLLRFFDSACFRQLLNKDSVINIHEMDMSQIQLDNQKRFLKSCKNLQVQLPQRPHGRVLGRLGWAWPGALRHNPDIQGLTETGILPSRAASASGDII
jgi:hypothetical protein